MVVNLNWFVFWMEECLRYLTHLKTKVCSCSFPVSASSSTTTSVSFFLRKSNLIILGLKKWQENAIFYGFFCFGTYYTHLSKMYGFLKTDLSDMSAHQKLWQIIHKRSHYPFATTITTFFSLTLCIFSGILLWRRARSQYSFLRSSWTLQRFGPCIQATWPPMRKTKKLRVTASSR